MLLNKKRKEYKNHIHKNNTINNAIKNPQQYT